LVVQNVLSPTTALLAIACRFANGVGTFSAVDLFGQPRVEQTYGIDTTSGFATPITFYSKYGAGLVTVGAGTQPLGNEPILINMADFATAGLNIQYSS
jgi:hypothetical protein